VGVESDTAATNDDDVIFHITATTLLFAGFALLVGLLLGCCCGYSVLMKRERTHCGNDNRFSTKPDANLAEHIAVQSSVAGSTQISTADSGKEAEVEMV